MTSGFTFLSILSNFTLLNSWKAMCLGHTLGYASLMVAMFSSLQLILGACVTFQGTGRPQIIVMSRPNCANPCARSFTKVPTPPNKKGGYSCENRTTRICPPQDHEQGRLQPNAQSTLSSQPSQFCNV